MSSGVISRASHLVERIGVCFHVWGSGKCWFIRARQESFFTCLKKLEVFGSLVPFIYTMMKQQASIIYIYLRSLMRVVAKILRMEIIMLDYSKICQMDLPLHLYQHTSRTRPKRADCLKFEVWRWELPIWGPIMLLYSHSAAFISQGSMGVMPLPWRQGGLAL